MVLAKNPIIKHASRKADRMAIKTNFIAELSDLAISRTFLISDVEVELISLDADIIIQIQ